MDISSIEGCLALARARQDLVWQRIKSQLGFAKWMTGRSGAPAEWAAAVAVAHAAAIQGTNGNNDPVAVCAVVESALAPLAPEAKSYRVRLVGHAHIDMNWQWSWPETVSDVCDTFTTVLDLMDEFPAFRFTQSQASVYEIVAEHRPDLLDRIAAKIREGRWEVAASHWVECDKNLVGGESLARHLLYTRRYLNTLFPGAIPDGGVRIDWSPDTFGHAATVPTYLAAGGVKYLYLSRPGFWRQDTPEAFWWEGPDGSRVLVRNDRKRSCNCVAEPDAVAAAVRDMAESTGLRETMFVYGVGDHGGGPTRRDILFGLEMQSWPVFPTIVFDGAEAFFQAVETNGTDLPVMRGELNTEFAGCYTSQSLVKRAAQIGEARLADAEAACALAAATGGPEYPARHLAEAWRKILFLHFHDILPGSCVRDTRTHAHGLFQEAVASAAAVETHALRELAGRVATNAIPGAAEATAATLPVNALVSGQGSGSGIRAAEGRFSDAHGHGTSPVRPFVVFNPVAHDRVEIVELTLWDREPAGLPPQFLLGATAFEAVLPDGIVLEMQRTAKGHGWGHAFVRYALPLTVPGLGYASVLVRETGRDAPARTATCPAEPVRALSVERTGIDSENDREDVGLENGLVRVRFDRRTGRIASFFDKVRGIELLDSALGGGGLEYSVERPHDYSAWTIAGSTPPVFPVAQSVETVLRGPFAASVRIRFAVAESEFNAEFSLFACDPVLRVRINGLWMQRGTPQTGVPNLRFALATALAETVPTYEIPFGSIRREGMRPDEEVPARRWAHLGGRVGAADAGLLLLNDCKHGHALEGSTLRLNLVRASYEPDPLPETGIHEMTIGIAPAGRECDASVATAVADAFCHPLIPVGTGVHAGTLPLTASLIAVEGGNVAVDGFKRAEDGNGLVMRLHETDGRAALARIVPHPAIGVHGAVAVDLHETPTGESPSRDADAFCVSIPPRGIRSVRLT